MEKKNYVVDTCILLEDHLAIKTLMNGEDNNIYVPYNVLLELDSKKKHPKLGWLASYALKEILENKSGNIYVLPMDKESPLTKKSTDSRILNEIKIGKIKNPILVTNDKVLQIQSRVDNLPCQEYKNSKPYALEDNLYSGVVDFAEENAQFIPNCFYWKEGKAYYNSYDGEKVLDYDNSIWKVTPRTPYQNMLFELLLDNNIKLLTVQSIAGLGKSFLALAAAFYLTFEKKQHKKIFITKPTIEIEDSLGYLPGPQPLDAKILTPTGWTTMGEIKKGDFVIGDDGKKTKVLEIYDKGEKDVFQIETTNGATTEACGDHVWAVKNVNDLKHKKPFRLMSTLDIKSTLINHNSGPKFNYSLPDIPQVEYDNGDNLPISPYILGVLLGDGCISAGSISFSSVDQEIIDRVEIELKQYDMFLTKNKNSISYTIRGNYKSNKPPRRVKITNIITKQEYIFETPEDAAKEFKIKKGTINSRCQNNTTINNYSFSYLPAKRYQNYIKNELYKLGLYGTKSSTKFIPDLYKFTSVKNRIDLLQGLMDTDGDVHIKKKSQSYYTSSKQLCVDVVELARSLGLNATYYSRDRIGRTSKYKNRVITYNGICYVVNIPRSKKLNIFHLTRKSNKADRSNIKITHNRIKDITYIGKKLVRCIKVDNTSSLYITNDFIITHNTLDDKLYPYFQYLDDLILKLHFSRPVNKLFTNPNDVFEGYNRKKLEILPIQYVRGRNIENSFVFIDEAQNISRHGMRSLLTRLGENCKCIIAGDINQIDSPYLDKRNNGLSWTVEKLKSHKNYGHITLKGKRSRGPICDMVLERGL